MVARMHQSGSTEAIVIAVLVVVLVGVLGWVFYQNTSGKDDVVITSTETSKQVPSGSEKETATVESRYVDFRTSTTESSGDGSGVSIAAVSDLAKLTGASQKLKDYIASRVGEEYVDMEGVTRKKTFTIDRVYGDYAAGQDVGSAYLIWGPENGEGEIAVVTGTQSIGFECNELKTAKVPQVLVDSKCFDSSNQSSTDLVDYKS